MISKEQARISSLVLALVFCAACATSGGGAGATAKAKTPPRLTWGSLKVIVATPSLYFSGQPDRAALVAAKAGGVSEVISLRGAKEPEGYDEAAVAAEVGLRFVRVPVGKPSLVPFDKKAFAAVSAAVEAAKGRKILLHCSSGNRVAAWYLAGLVAQGKLAKQKALELGKGYGLTKSGARVALERHLGL